ncbi:MAG: hypothetical protein HYY86_01885 [Candidatus Harrisonbacteria bacterium]|nr:hypothetical protein [Candidatus Harrisonbacteria bacterium]
MKKIKKKYYFLLSTFYFLTTQMALAQGLVPCSGLDCTLCDFLVLAKNLIDLMLKWGVALAALFFAWGAFVIMTAGGSEEKVTEGRKIMTTVAVGVLIAFTAWLIIGTLMQVLTNSPSKLPWNQIQCTLK